MDWDRFTDDDLVGAASAEVRHDGVASGVQAQTLSLLCPRPPPPHPSLPTLTPENTLVCDCFQ